MAAKNKMPQVGSWAFLVLLVLAVVSGLLNLSDGFLTAVLVILGIVVGLLNITGREVGLFLISAIAFIVAASSLGQVPLIGKYLGAVMSNIVTAIAPAAAVVALKALFVLAKEE